jgi:hypothetical protein
MALEGNAEYALARVQARHGARPVPSEWRRLESSHDLGQFLEAARSSLFGPWIATLDRNRDIHVIERTLRQSWRDYVRKVASWHPRRWQAWLNWIEWLPTLELIAQLGRKDSRPAWIQADPILGAAPGAGSALELFAPAISGTVVVTELWLSRWRALQPSVDGDTTQLLAMVAKAVREYVQRLGLEDADTAALNERLRERLRRVFRAAAGSPVASLCHLALMALDFERLRGDLLSRALFAHGG